MSRPGEYDEDTLKILTVELQKAAQGRSEMMNALIELELFANQQAQTKKSTVNLYSALVWNEIQRLENPSVGDSAAPVTLPAPSIDMDVRCFPAIRRPESDARKVSALSKEALYTFRLFDV